MATMTHDAPVVVPPRTATGIAVALLSAVSFALSGALASPLLDAGWSAGAVVLVRIGAGALVVLPFGVAALHGRWDLLWRNLPLVVMYGLIAVAGAQFCYFSAVQYLDVGPALLIEYTAPAAVVLWLWIRHGQRPGRLTIGGAAVAALGLLLRARRRSPGFGLHAGGVAWALAAMVGCATYFVVSADESNGLPPMALAAGGLVVGGLALAALGVVGVLPMHAERAPVEYAGVDVAWWVPLVAARRGDGRAVLRRRHRRRPDARLAAGVVRRAVGGRGRRAVGLAAPRRAARGCCSWSAACWSWPAWSGSSSARNPRSGCNRSLPDGVSRAWMWG